MNNLEHDLCHLVKSPIIHSVAGLQNRKIILFFFLVLYIGLFYPISSKIFYYPLSIYGQRVRRT